MGERQRFFSLSRRFGGEGRGEGGCGSPPREAAPTPRERNPPHPRPLSPPKPGERGKRCLPCNNDLRRPYCPLPLFAVFPPRGAADAPSTTNVRPSPDDRPRAGCRVRVGTPAVAAAR